MSLDQKTRESPRGQQEDQAAPEPGGVVEEGGQIVDVSGAGAASPGADRPNDRVVTDVPKERASGAAHPQSPAEALRAGGFAVCNPRNTSFRNEVKSGMDEPPGQASSPKDFREPRPAEALEGLGLVGE
jgi:hypothetical protein